MSSPAPAPSTGSGPASRHGLSSADMRAVSRQAARLAVRALYAELALYPKPGLVSLVDNGSHEDMTALTFMRSLFSLRHYFAAICRAGMEDAPFTRLKQLGIAAERRMMAATGGVNTHRGAIFALGMLCAALGRQLARPVTASAASRRTAPAGSASLRAALLAGWGNALAAHTLAAPDGSHGQRAAQLHAASGAREEAALGLPSVFLVGLPALETTLARSGDMHLARVDALFALMAHVSDTNVLHRGGKAGAETVRHEARRFLALGGTAHPDWRAHALGTHRLFVHHKLSPGGAADLLAACCLVHAFSAQAWG
ncbi:triphosphoribosyl-dephospho-CoA synthase MdcB [Pseudoduganella sp. UC29_71]|uniref:triphosphoribosyl-dephospho-CoA synthase MdcB n=1 Tax=Pseudoduganella sp. UC29_71 TaxID=3350174 RepID=UPI0036735E5D